MPTRRSQTNVRASGRAAPDPRVSARREARRRELLDAALRALERHGAGASMDQMALEAGVTKPILYRHFGDQRGLAEALALRMVEEIRDAIAPVEAADLRTRTARQLDAGLRVLEHRPGLFEFLSRERGVGRGGSGPGGSLDVFATYLGALLAARGLDPSAAEPWAQAISGMFHHATLWWLRGGDVSRAQLVDHLMSLLWNGLGGLLDDG